MSRPYATKGWVFPRAKVAHLTDSWVTRGGSPRSTVCGHVLRVGYGTDRASWYSLDQGDDPMPMCTSCHQTLTYRIDALKALMKP